MAISGFALIRISQGDAGFDFVIEDGNGGLGTARIAVTVLPQNDAPMFVIEESDFASFEDAAINWRLPSGFAVDADGDMLTLTARLSSGDALPEWLTFDGAGFEGTPPTDFNGSIEIELFADDGTTTSSVPLTLKILAVNDAPQVVSPIQDIALQPGEQFIFVVPNGAFADVESDPITLEIVAADGGELPDWLTVDGLSISGTVPSDLVESVQIAVVANDGQASNIASFALIPVCKLLPPHWVDHCPLSQSMRTQRSTFRYRKAHLSTPTVIHCH